MDQPKKILFIDILGFSDLVKEHPEKVEEIFEIFDGLTVHQHYAFKTIVFSDTILVYNEVNPVSQHDHEYLVMYMCEFAQDLLYRLISKDIFFQAIILEGNFSHGAMENIEYFYGEGLVDAYERLKGLACTGLLLDRSCAKYNKIFPTARYNKSTLFVYLNKCLDNLQILSCGTLPVHLSLFEDNDELWHIVQDLEMLRNIHFKMNEYPDPKVRAKFLMTWNFYLRRYRYILDELQSRKFEPEAICQSYDWKKHVNNSK